MRDLEIVPVDLTEANAFVAQFHRHHKPVQGHKFSLGVKNGHLRGVAIVGRPVARHRDDGATLEVTRLATDGTKNACSALYAAAARAAKAMGYARIQTYILGTEPGTSLRAAGWVCEERVAGGGLWLYDGKPRRADQPLGTKQRWALALKPQEPSP